MDDPPLVPLSGGPGCWAFWADRDDVFAFLVRCLSSSGTPGSPCGAGIPAGQPARPGLEPVLRGACAAETDEEVLQALELLRARMQGTSPSNNSNKLSQQIYQKLGLHFDDKKIYFLKTRVAKRMAALGFHDPQEYVFMVSYADPEGMEMQALANLVTTNETYMFREYDQLQAFANYCLPEVLSAKQARGEQKPADLVRGLLLGRRSLHPGDDRSGSLSAGPVLGLRDRGDRHRRKHAAHRPRMRATVRDR